jgi:hypothetical protein
VAKSSRSANKSIVWSKTNLGLVALPNHGTISMHFELGGLCQSLPVGL